MKTYVILGIAVIVIGGLFVVLRGGDTEDINVGSIDATGAYNSTTTNSTFANAAVARQLKLGPGILGSIIVSSTSPEFTTAGTFFGLYDGYGITSTSSATSTLALLKGINVATAQTAVSGATQGTFVYDAVFTKGLLLDVPLGFNGIITVTWK